MDPSRFSETVRGSLPAYKYDSMKGAGLSTWTAQSAVGQERSSACVRFAPEAVIRPRYRFGYPPRLAPNAHDGLNGDLPTLTRLSRFAGLV